MYKLEVKDRSKEIRFTLSKNEGYEIGEMLTVMSFLRPWKVRCVMRRLNIVVIVLAAFCVSGWAEDQKGLVAHWNFDDGKGDVLHDRSGNNNHGKIHGAKWVKSGKGYALKFDGVDDWVEVPSSKSLNSIRRKGSIEFWYKISADAGFPGILTIKSKGVSWPDMRLAVFVRRDNIVFGYVADGKKYTSASGPVTRDEWAYFVLTWDGSRCKAYANGVLTGESSCPYGPDVTGLPLWIGRTQGITKPAFFKGELDGLVIHDHVLDEPTVRHRAGAVVPEAVDNAGLPTKSIARTKDAGKFVPVHSLATVRGKEIRVIVGAKGRMQIDVRSDSYIVESCWPYPGPNRKIGWNGLPAAFNMDSYPDVTKQLGAETVWAPKVTRTSQDTITVTAAGKCYRLNRTIKAADGRVDILDTFTNLRDAPTAIMPRNRITANHDYRARFCAGLEVAANPTIFLAGPRGSIGVVLQDSVSRRRIRPWVPQRGNRAGFHVTRVALDKGKTRTFSWSVYILNQGEGYLDFVNRIRGDWNANFTIHGPGEAMYLDDMDGNFRFSTAPSRQWKLESVRKDPSELRAYLKWKRVRVMFLTPWLDYDPTAFDHVLSRKEYKQLMRKFIPVIRQVDPEIKVLGCIETPYITIFPQRIKDGHKLPRAEVGQPTGLLNKELTMEQVRIIEAGAQQWKDSFIRSADGKLFYEIYVRGGKPVEPAVRVYPQVGNGQYRFLMDQVKFLLDEVGMDGIYFDMFALGQVGSFRTYTGEWDGISADVDFNTGEIHGKYVDCSLAAIEAKVNLVNYLHSRGKIVFANRHSTSHEEQSLPVNRFTETGWVLKDMNWKDGTKPPAFNYLFFAHLNSPLGYGLDYAPGKKPDIRRIMKSVIAYLRHGMVCFYALCHVPDKSDPAGAGFGPINHMFPITPVELGEGFIVAEERILSAVSMNRLWKKQGKPVVRVFDMTGRETDGAGRYEIKPENNQWRIILKLKDWAEIAVVE